MINAILEVTIGCYVNRLNRYFSYLGVGMEDMEKNFSKELNSDIAVIS